VRRLLQFGVLFLSLAAFLTPLIEFFDRWDPPGPGNDTELAVFGLILIFCLILLVSRLVASLDKLIERVTLFRVQPSQLVRSPERFYFTGLVTPHSSPPLRI
jgi:hypothetical protein